MAPGLWTSAEPGAAHKRLMSSQVTDLKNTLGGGPLIRYSSTMRWKPDMIDDEWMEWYRLTPQERWRETEKLWSFFLSAGGSLDPEPDTQSPFHDALASGAVPAHGRPGLRVIRRSGI